MLRAEEHPPDLAGVGCGVTLIPDPRRLDDRIVVTPRGGSRAIEPPERMAEALFERARTMLEGQAQRDFIPQIAIAPRGTAVVYEVRQFEVPRAGFPACRWALGAVVSTPAVVVEEIAQGSRPCNAVAGGSEPDKGPAPSEIAPPLFPIAVLVQGALHRAVGVQRHGRGDFALHPRDVGAVAHRNPESRMGQFNPGAGTNPRAEIADRRDPVVFPRDPPTSRGFLSKLS